MAQLSVSQYKVLPLFKEQNIVLYMEPGPWFSIHVNTACTTRHHWVWSDEVCDILDGKTGLKLSVLQVIHMATSSWNSVSFVTATNCFRKARCLNTSATLRLRWKRGKKKKTNVAPNPEIQFKDFVKYDDDYSKNDT